MLCFYFVIWILLSNWHFFSVTRHLSHMPITRVNWKVQRMMSYLLVNDFFILMSSKYCNTNGRSVQTTWETMLNNKLHLIIFHHSILDNLWTFQPTFISQWLTPKRTKRLIMIACEIIQGSFLQMTTLPKQWKLNLTIFEYLQMTMIFCNCTLPVNKIKELNKLIKAVYFKIYKHLHIYLNISVTMLITWN